ncbi:MAG TPA: hypothetical protein VF996_00540 [Candidatus Saccharimonadales bacterium]
MDQGLLIAAFVAGVLTVLAPCIFSALPLILGRGADGYAKARRVILGLLGSIFVFTFLLKASTALLAIPTSFWQALSGSIIALVGISMFWPDIYAKLALKLGLERAGAKSQQKAMALSGASGDYILGAALGPVFSACSPTYALIVAIILPNNAAQGTLYLLAFLSGLGLFLAAIALGGQKLIARLNWSLDPHGKFKRGVGLMLILLGVMIATGLEKDILAWLVSNGLYDWQIRLEENLR